MNEARVFFAGPPGSQSAQGRLEVYDGVTLAPNGAATLGPLVHVSPTLTYAPNTFAVANLASGVTVTSGVLVVAFTIDANPNASIPALGCIGGYSASFATDTLVVPGACTVAPHRNLVFDPIAGWWDVTGFGGGIWCGQSYDGDWAIRACVTSLAPPATYPGTGEDFIQRSALDGAVLDTVDIKPVAPFQLVTVALASPGQTFVGSPLVLVAELFTTGAPPAPAFPGIAVSGQLSTIVVIGTATSPFGSPLLPPTQTAVSFVVSPVLVGQSVLFQGLVPATFARNGIFASTPGHELVVQ